MIFNYIFLLSLFWFGQVGEIHIKSYEKNNGVGMIIQARMGSSRLPGKVCKIIKGKEMLYHQIERLRSFGFIEKYPLVIATTKNNEDDIIMDVAKETNVQAFRGSVSDVSKRFIEAAEEYKINKIIRLSGDDPLVDPNCIEAVYNAHHSGNYDVTTGAHKNGWIFGTTTAIIEFKALKTAYQMLSHSNPERLTTSFVKFDSIVFKINKISPPDNQIRTDILLSVDYLEDFILVSEILSYFIDRGLGYNFSNRDIIKLCDMGIFELNNKHLHKPFDD